MSNGRRRLTMTALCAMGVVAMAMALTGCKWLIPFTLIGEHKEKFPAEYDKLSNSKVLILVWAQPETLFDFPNVRLELTMHIGDRLAAEVDDIEIVNVLQVEDRIQQSLEATADPVAMGEHFRADKVVYLELLEMHLRSPDAPSLLHGRIRASVAVYDLNAKPGEPRRYELLPVDVEYPENQPLLYDPTNVRLVKAESYSKFAETVARKFYDYEEATL